MARSPSCGLGNLCIFTKFFTRKSIAWPSRLALSTPAQFEPRNKPAPLARSRKAESRPMNGHQKPASIHPCAPLPLSCYLVPTEVSPTRPQLLSELLLHLGRQAEVLPLRTIRNQLGYIASAFARPATCRASPPFRRKAVPSALHLVRHMMPDRKSRAFFPAHRNLVLHHPPSPRLSPIGQT